MGQHRSDRRIRGVSKGPVIAVVATLLLVLAVVGWLQVKDRTDSQGTAAAGTCVEGPVTLTVAADPDIAAQITDLAARFTATRPVLRDHCVTVAVSALDSPAVADALAAAPWNDRLGAAPALWIPSSTASINRVPGKIDGQPKPIASTPIVLAARPGIPEIAWRDLPRADLSLALPTASSATYAALDAVAAATAGAGTGPLDETQAASPQVRAAISALAHHAVAGAPSTTADTLAALAAGHAAFQAVPATEQQIRGFDGIVAVAPTGATPVADHPAAILDAPWVDQTLGRAAAQFVDFLRQPDQQQSLTAAGFHTDGPAGALTPATGAAAATLSHTFANPAVPQTTTILLDISGSMSDNDGAGTRLNNTVTALTTQIDTLPAASNTGLWVYSRGLDAAKPYRVAVPTGPLSDGDRRARLESALRSLRPATATSTYASVIAAHQAAVDGYTPGRPNSVLLITDGPDDDTSTSAQKLLQALDGPAHPVRVDVVSIGTNRDQATLQQIADRTGGTLVAVPSTQGPALADALGKLLG